MRQKLPKEEIKRRNKERSRKYYWLHKEEQDKKCRERYQNNKEYYRKWGVEYRSKPDKKEAHWKRETNRKFGPNTTNIYYELLEKQNNTCAICFTLDPKTKNKKWCVDHDHNAGNIRGLLCSNCNLGLGHFQDNTTFLCQAVNYLGGEKK